jgi:hypothetical protein
VLTRWGFDGQTVLYLKSYWGFDGQTVLYLKSYWGFDGQTVLYLKSYWGFDGQNISTCNYFINIFLSLVVHYRTINKEKLFSEVYTKTFIIGQIGH